MPSIEEACVISPSDASTTQDFLARDMEELVSEMKENLRLSAYKSKHSQRTSRPSPYQIPSRWGDNNSKSCALSTGIKTCSVHSCYNKKSKSADTDNPYELLQDLIRDGSLIKEAVRRLQKGFWPKQRYIYDSDEEPRSPMKLCQQ